ncbi:hypothetical protein [Mycobacterium sp.]|uniref:hypothetical protein n=1 Tax=Mycobacterium sp. TaxID=1785 RepID=UPI003BB639BF
MKRLIGALLVQNALACVADVAATVCCSEIGFLLASTNRREDLRTLHGSWLIGLNNLFYLVVIAICYIG